MKVIFNLFFLSILFLLVSCEGAKLTVEHGTGSGIYKPGAKIKINAYLPNPGYEFAKWTGDTNTVEDIFLNETYIIIPDYNDGEELKLNIMATYEVDPSAKEYTLIVENGSGGGDYLTYSLVNIKADNPPENYEFYRWEGDIQYLSNPYLNSQHFVIKKEDITLTAVYKEKVIPTPVPTVEPIPDLGDLPSPKGHNATFLFNGAKLRMMNILSPKISRNEFKSYVIQMKNQGANFVYLYLINQGDGPWTPYSFYKNNQIGQNIDQRIVNEYKARLEYIRGKNLGIILWLRADDSGDFNSTPVVFQEKYQEDAVNYFDDVTSGYVIGLEAEEYQNATTTNHYAGHIKQFTSKEIGVHQTIDKIDHCLQSNIDACYYQYGFGKSASQIKNATISAIRALKGKPLYAAEYHLSSETSEAKLLGDAAISGGASGTGNGRNNAGTSSGQQ